MKLLHLSLLAFALAAPNALALSSDTEQPVYIDSDSQELDMKSSKVTFIGNVKLKQGSINITADKILVLQDSKTSEIQSIEAFGDPATFSQLTDDGKTLNGESKELHYALSSDRLTMTNNAKLSQDGNTISGTVIKYEITSQKLTADGDSQQRVSTVLQPTKVNN